MKNKQILNFDNYEFRCSSLGKIMTEPQGKSNLEIYEDVCSKLSDLESSYSEKIAKAKSDLDAIENKTLKKYETAKSKLEKLQIDFKVKQSKLLKEKAEIEPIKDIKQLSDTCKSYLVEIYIEEKTGRRKDLNNRYIRKGNEVEDNSIDLLSQIDDAFYVKNTLRKRNGFIQGELDIDHEDLDIIKDIKSSWDVYTHYQNVLKSVNKIYWWQGQGYMWLWGRKFYEICYVLVNTPSGIVDDEKKRLLFSMGSDKAETEVYRKACEEVDFNSFYDDIPAKERVIKIPFSFDESIVERVKERVIACREWLNDYAEKEWNRSYNYQIEEIPFEDVKEDTLLDIVQEVVEESKEVVEDIIEDIIEQSSKEDSEQVYEEKEEEIVLKPKESKPIEILKESLGMEEIPKQEINHQDPIEISKKIQSCQNEKECLDLYKLIKQEFSKFPNLKDELTEKKASFKPKIEPVEPPIREAKKEAENKPTEAKEELKDRPVSEIKKVIQKDLEQEITEITEEKIRDMINNCKTAADVKAIYNKYRDFLEPIKTGELVKWMLSIGQQLQINPKS